MWDSNSNSVDNQCDVKTYFMLQTAVANFWQEFTLNSLYFKLVEKLAYSYTTHRPIYTAIDTVRFSHAIVACTPTQGLTIRPRPALHTR